MEYTIKELARLAGVSTRTLRWYDKVGLLKPTRITEAKYRMYDEASVARLQQTGRHMTGAKKQRPRFWNC